MTMTRRRFAKAAAGSACAPLVAQRRGKGYIVYAGTYTGPDSKGIYAWRFQPGSGELAELGAVGETPNPSFLAIDGPARHLYAANEIGDYGGQRSGSVTSFAIEPGTGKLTAINTVATKGGGPCYVSLHNSGKWVFAANYGGGSVAVLPVADGRLGEAASFEQHKGSGADPKRQRGPHAHCIKPSPDGRFVLAADLGTDEIIVYRFDAATGKLAANDPPSFKTKPGSGPRHFAFHPNERLVYIINELASTVTAASWDAKAGKLAELQTVSTLPAGFDGENSTAEIVVHPNGRLLFGSNRGHDSIAVFAIDAQGKLTPKEHVSTKGQVPRNFALDPTGKYLFAANQKSNNIQVFQLDNGGRLTHTGKTLEVSSPVCVRFAPAG
jgi:6-phosphogluconolactonase